MGNYYGPRPGESTLERANRLRAIIADYDRSEVAHGRAIEVLEREGRWHERRHMIASRNADRHAREFAVRALECAELAGEAGDQTTANVYVRMCQTYEYESQRALTQAIRSTRLASTEGRVRSAHRGYGLGIQRGRAPRPARRGARRGNSSRNGADSSDPGSSDPPPRRPGRGHERRHDGLRRRKRFGRCGNDVRGGGS